MPNRSLKETAQPPSPCSHTQNFLTGAFASFPLPLTDHKPKESFTEHLLHTRLGAELYPFISNPASGKHGVFIPILQVENLRHGEKRFAHGLISKIWPLHRPWHHLVSHSLQLFALSRFVFSCIYVREVFISACIDFASSSGPSYSLLGTKGLEWHRARSKCSTNIDQ